MSRFKHVSVSVVLLPKGGISPEHFKAVTWHQIHMLAERFHCQLTVLLGLVYFRGLHVLVCSFAWRTCFKRTMHLSLLSDKVVC